MFFLLSYKQGLFSNVSEKFTPVPRIALERQKKVR